MDLALNDGRNMNVLFAERDRLHQMRRMHPLGNHISHIQIGRVHRVESDRERRVTLEWRARHRLTWYSSIRVLTSFSSDSRAPTMHSESWV